MPYYKISKKSADAFRKSSSMLPRQAVRPAVSPVAIRPAAVHPAPEKTVTKIAHAPIEGKKLRTAYYARVSSLLESQQQSIESQQIHFEEYIRSNPEMVFAGAYVDEGVTGTKADIRPQLQRLIADCKDHKLDFICTKSVSRFARDTKDCLELVRLLTSLGVTIWFEENEIRTDSMTSEFMLTLLASIAESESHSISGNMKWGIRKRFQDGTYKQPVPPYGYAWSGDKLVIVESEAAIVREIFAMALSGNGSTVIADMLNARKVSSPAGKTWCQTTVHKILKNVAYTGDALYQKTYKDERFRQVPNNGELDQYYSQDHHEGIISREDFERAQGVIALLAESVGYRAGEGNNRSTHRYCFTGIVHCASCGTTMHRQTWGGRQTCWICNRHSNQKELCSMKPQSEEDLKRAFINCLNKLAWSQRQPEHRILDLYEDLLGRTEAERNAERLAQIESELEENRRETRRLNAIIMRERFLPEHREKKSLLTKQERELMKEKYRILMAKVPKGSLQELRGFISGWKIAQSAEAFPENAFTDFVEDCVVDSGKAVAFRFKCGLQLTESLYKVEETK